MTEPNRHPAVTDDERTTLANVPPEAWAGGLAMLRDPSPWLRNVARLIREEESNPRLLKAYCVVLEADPAHRKAYAEWARREYSRRVN